MQINLKGTYNFITYHTLKAPRTPGLQVLMT